MSTKSSKEPEQEELSCGETGNTANAPHKNPYTFYLAFAIVRCAFLFVLYYCVLYDWTYGGLILPCALIEMFCVICHLSHYVEYKDTPDNKKPDFKYYTIFHWYYFDFLNWRKRKKPQMKEILKRVPCFCLSGEVSLILSLKKLLYNAVFCPRA